MLQTDKNCSTSKMSAFSGNSGGNQADIVKRLEELNKWQEEQKKLLEVKQTIQRQMLGMEQKTMYQMLGLQNDEDFSEIEESRQDIAKDNGGQYAEFEEYTENTVEYEHPDEEQEDRDGHKSTEPSSYKTLTSGYGTEECLEAPVKKPKKPFLKRGEGLKQRFKVDPEELRINNLPRYKYANAHPNLRLKRQRPLNSVKNKTTARPPSPKLSSSAVLDAQEQRFQQLLISSKNVCNSTPDNKSSLINSKNMSGGSSSATSSACLPKVRFVDSVLTTVKDIQECPDSKSPTTQTLAVAWSKILDSQQIQPFAVPRKTIPDTDLPQSEEDIFELLEQKAKNGSFDMNSTCIKQFMQRRITAEKFNDTDVIPINDQLKVKRLQPIVVRDGRQDDEGSSVEEVEETSFLTDNTIEAEEETPNKTLTKTLLYAAPRIAENRVRFSDSHDTHEYQEEDTATDTSAMTNGGEGDHTNNEFFEQFKQALFAALQVKADHHDTVNTLSDTTVTPKDSFVAQDPQMDRATEELHEETNMIKIRLLELEKEIATFKENNIQLMKAKQEHELEKSLHAQEQLEASERLKDEKIQMEIYLHDERMKLEEERRKFEQQLKTKAQSATSKERKEIEKLREQVTQLEMQLKNKDCNHAAAQARWRTQIRTMEREEKRLHEQIEMLTKENKRLENEMMKVSRDSNNKLLQEINRNIAKLAPKQAQYMSATFPDDNGMPPVLPSTKTMSQTIAAAATANKNSKTPSKPSHSVPAQKKNKKVVKISNTRSIKRVNSMPETPSSEEAESTPNTSYDEDKNTSRKNQKQQTSSYLSIDDDEEDILKELQTSPSSNRRAKASNNANKKSPKSNTELPPPASPTSNMKREIINADGSKDIWYPNGNLKKISADGMLIRMLYFNKDIKETNINEGTVKYYYAETNTWHTTYLDGLEILEFPNGQIEHRHKNGVVEVHYPNNSVKTVDPRDDKKLEEWRFPDGTHLVQMRNGDKILSLPNGQKEIHTKLQKRREYPDGTVKIVYPDGSTETRYSNGRVRLKDKDGNLVMDTEETK